MNASQRIAVLFPTVTFAIFFLIVLPLNWLTMHNPRSWRIFILVASYLFYAWWDPWFVLLLAGSTLFNQLIAVRIDASSAASVRRLLLWVGIAGNLGFLAWFKYWNFFASSAQNAAGTLGIQLDPGFVSTVLPIGISFYTFMALSYIIDTWRGTYHPVSLSRFAVFLSFFPHLVAGPIVRPAELIPQFDNPPDARSVDATRGFALILGGLFLKVVLASTAATIVDPVFASPKQHSALETLVAIYAYAVQIFSDFAGYSTIAIGAALLLGFRFPDNFNSPYRATSVQDFWRRWHMTLSRWLRDYLYIPLGGNRGSRFATECNLMATMVIGGLWHGASWTFIFWGALHGSAMIVERLRRERREARGKPPPPKWRAWLVTFNFVCFAWIFFRADSFGQAFSVIERVFTGWGQPSPGITLGVLAAVATGLAIQFLPVNFWSNVQIRVSLFPYYAQGAAAGVALMVINVLGPAGVAPFIYFQF